MACDDRCCAVSRVGPTLARTRVGETLATSRVSSTLAVSRGGCRPPSQSLPAGQVALAVDPGDVTYLLAVEVDGTTYVLTAEAA